MTQQTQAAGAVLHRVGSLADLKAGNALRANVNGTRIAVFLNDGVPVATAGRCPHAQGPLHEGEVENGVLTCPWHGWTFDLRTGACDDDPSLVLHRYETVVESDDILVRL